MAELTFDDYLARVSIQDVLKDAGYVQNRRDGLRYPSYVRLDTDGRRIRGDKFIVTANGKCCFHPPEQKLYNAISFITAHPQMFREYRPGVNAYGLVHQVCGRLLNQPAQSMSPKALDPIRERKPFDIGEYEVTPYRKYDYDSIKKFYPYFKDRKIDIATQRAFADHFMLASRKESAKGFKNLSFPLTVPGMSDVVGLEERGRSRIDGTSGYKGKAIGSNSSEGLWIASPNGTPIEKAKDVYWFESAYDAMAYYQLHSPTDKELGKAVFLSSGGTPTAGHFSGVINAATEACHHICFDNDLSGRQFASNFDDALKRIREAMPKVCDDMREYMASLTDPKDLLSGDEDLLPEDLYNAHGRYFDAMQEAMSMRDGGVSGKDDIEAQTELASQCLQEYKRMLSDKLCIGREQGRLKTIGTYDIPEWAMTALEYGDFQGLTEEEERLVTDFAKEHFPDGYVMVMDTDPEQNSVELNFRPAFGERNPNALVDRGESPYLGVKTYEVAFLHPTERDGAALPNLTVKRELPMEGCKDWNEQLIRQEEAKIEKEQAQEEEQSRCAGIDLDADGAIEITESEETKQRKHGR